MPSAAPEAVSETLGHIPLHIFRLITMTNLMPICIAARTPLKIFIRFQHLDIPGPLLHQLNKAVVYESSLLHLQCKFPISAPSLELQELSFCESEPFVTVKQPRKD